MKNIKKQKWFRKNWNINVTIGIIILIILSLFWYFGDFPYNEDRQCKHKRDDWVKDMCICDNIKNNEGFFSWGIVNELGGKDNFIKNYNKRYPTDIVRIWESERYDGVEFEYCDGQFRKKTQSELDIDDCNSNPREDEKCKCEKNLTILSEANYTLFDKSNNITFILGLRSNKYGQGFSDNQILKFTNNSISIIKTEFIISSQECIKSRPKTECEKGNPDWVEEKTCDCLAMCWIDNARYYNNEQECPSHGYFGNVTDELYKSKCCQNEQTICQEKGELQ